ncbi:hypothetical protein DDD63_10760 [Actinobaculum sp. 313]|nr:hypothetical protein DDD63_10760 [Actinobaculum sp. 313]
MSSGGTLSWERVPSLMPKGMPLVQAALSGGIVIGVGGVVGVRSGVVVELVGVLGVVSWLACQPQAARPSRSPARAVSVRLMIRLFLQDVLRD